MNLEEKIPFLSEDVRETTAAYLEYAIRAYNMEDRISQENSPLAGHHYTDTCVALFEGTLEDCEAVRNFIIDRKEAKKTQGAS